MWEYKAHCCRVSSSSGAESRCSSTASAPFSHTCKPWGTHEERQAAEWNVQLWPACGPPRIGSTLACDQLHACCDAHLATHAEVVLRAEPCEQCESGGVVGVDTLVVPSRRDQAVALFPDPPEPCKLEHLQPGRGTCSVSSGNAHQQLLPHTANIPAAPLKQSLCTNAVSSSVPSC